MEPHVWSTMALGERGSALPAPDRRVLLRTLLEVKDPCSRVAAPSICWSWAWYSRYQTSDALGTQDVGWTTPPPLTMVRRRYCPMDSHLVGTMVLPRVDCCDTESCSFSAVSRDRKRHADGKAAVAL